MGKHKFPAPDQNLMFLSLCTVLQHSRCGLSKLMYLLPPFAFGDVRLHKKLQIEGPLQGLPRFLIGCIIMARALYCLSPRILHIIKLGNAIVTCVHWCFLNGDNSQRMTQSLQNVNVACWQWSRCLNTWAPLNRLCLILNCNRTRLVTHAPFLCM